MTSAQLGKISLQIPWSNFWSGHVIVRVHDPRIYLACGPPTPAAMDDALAGGNGNASSLGTSQDLTASLTDAAGSLLNEDAEGQSLAQSLQDSLNVTDTVASAAGTPDVEAGSIAASLVEGLLSRLKIELTNGEVSLSKSESQTLADVKLTVGHVSLHTDTEETPASREKTRRITVQDVGMWSTAAAAASRNRSHSSASSSRSSPASSSSSSSHVDDNDLLAMSQAVGDLAQSAVSTYEDAEEGQDENEAEAAEQSPTSSSTPPPPDHKRILSLGSEPIEMRFSTKKTAAAANADADDAGDDAASSPSPRPTISSSSTSLRVDIGAVVCYLDDDDACNVWSLIQVLLAEAPNATEPKQKAKPQPGVTRQIDFSINVAAVHLLTAYQSRNELTVQQQQSLSESLANLWTPSRILRTHPLIGHLRLRVDALCVNGHLEGSGGSGGAADNRDRSIDVTLQSVALYDHLPVHGACAACYLPVVIFDDVLGSDSDSAHAYLHDWRSEEATAASANNGHAWGPYLRTGFNEKAWKLRAKTLRRATSSASNPADARTFSSASPQPPSVHLQSSRPTNLTISSLPMHVFADLSLADRLVPFLHRLGAANDAERQKDADGSSLASSVDTLGGGAGGGEEQQYAAAASKSSIAFNVSIPFVRAQVRVPGGGGGAISNVDSHSDAATTPPLRSGLLAMDLVDVAARFGEAGDDDDDEQGEPPRPRARARFDTGEDDADANAKTQMSARQALLHFQPVGSQHSTRVASLTALGEDDDDDDSESPPLRPRLSLSASHPTTLHIPLVTAFLSKPVIDGLQLLADDVGIWSRRLARIGESSQDEQDGLRVLGSRFFGSRAGLSALSSTADMDESTGTVGGRGGGERGEQAGNDHADRRSRTAPSAGVIVEVTEIAGELVVPRQERDDSQDSAQRPRTLRVKAQDLHTTLNPLHAKSTTSVDLSILKLDVSEDGKDGNALPILAAALPQSLTRTPTPMLVLRMLLYADPDSSYRESKVEPLLRGLTLTMTDDADLLGDIAHFAKAPEGAFQDVEPNELTRLHLKVENSNVHLAPSIIDDRGALTIGDLSVNSRLVGDSPQTTYAIGLQDSFLYLVDKSLPVPSEKQRRVKTASDHWTSQGYAKALDLKDIQGGFTTSRLTLPEIELRINRVRGHLEACADTLEVLGRLIPAIAPKKEEHAGESERERSGDDRARTADTELSSSESETASTTSGGNLLGSVDEDAFRTAPTMDSIPDMLEDDIPSRPDFFGQTEVRGEHSQQQQQKGEQASAKASDFETMPLSEEDFFGQESIASLVQPKREAEDTTSTSQSRPNDSKVVLQSDVVTVRLLDPRGVQPTLGYFSNPDLAPRKRSITGNFASSFRLRVEDCDLALKLYAGYDWKATRSEIEEEIKRVRRRLQKIKQLLSEGQKPDDSVEEAAQDLFASVHIAVDPEVDAAGALSALDDELGLQSETASSASTWQPLPRSGSQHRTSAANVGAFAAPRKRTKLERSTQSMIDFVFKGVGIEYDSLVPDAPLASSVGVTVKAMQILDNIKTSTWHAFLTEMRNEQRRHEASDANMLKVQLLSLRTSQDREELRVRAKVSPLRLHVDQDALDFLKKFFAFKKPSEAAREASQPPQEDSTPATGPFIQYAEVYPIKMKLDYKPKRVDYGLLRRGKTIEMMNFFHFDGAEMTLRHLTLRGITGWPRLFDTLNDIWTPDVKANQLADVLSGIAPVRSIVNVGAGVADLILLPIEQYQKDGRIVKGVRRGASRFARVTALEALKLGAKLATGTQAMLEKAEVALGAGGSGSGGGGASAGSRSTAKARRQDDDDDDSDEEEQRGNSAAAPYSLPLIDEEEHQALISKYADQPNGLSEALAQAYKGLRGGVTSAAQTILAVPMEVYERDGSGSGGGGGRRKVVKAVPVAVVQGARGASEAVSKTLMGLRGALDSGSSGSGYEDGDKYKRRGA